MVNKSKYRPKFDADFNEIETDEDLDDMPVSPELTDEDLEYIIADHENRMELDYGQY